MRKHKLWISKCTSGLLSLSLILSGVLTLPVSAEEGIPEDGYDEVYDEEFPEGDGEDEEILPSIFVVTGFDKFEKDQEGKFLNEETAAKYGTLTALPGTPASELKLPEDLTLNGYWQAEGPELPATLTMVDMDWKLKSDTDEVYSESSPEGTYTFIPDYHLYVESAEGIDDIVLAEGVKDLEITLTIASAAANPSEQPADSNTDDTALPDGSTDGSADVPGDGSSDIPADGSVDIPGDGSSDIPVDGSADIPADSSSDIPTDGSVDIPVDGSSDISADDSTSLDGIDNNDDSTDEDIFSNLDDSMIDADNTQTYQDGQITDDTSDGTIFIEENNPEDNADSNMIPVDETSPSDANTILVDDDTLADGNTTPADDNTTPADDSTTSADGSTTPADDIPAPVDADTTPEGYFTFYNNDTKIYETPTNAPFTLVDGGKLSVSGLPCGADLTALTVEFTDSTGSSILTGIDGSQILNFSNDAVSVTYAENTSNNAYSFNLTVQKLAHGAATGATCTSNAHCSVCGVEIPNTVLGHIWTDATCTAPKTCTRCGATEGAALGHTSKNDATCTSNAHCSVCGVEIANTALGHDWMDATCTDPKTCSRCNATEGSALGHDMHDDWETIAESTDSEHGTQERYCHRDLCDYFESRDLNIIGAPERNAIQNLSQGANYDLNTRLTFTAVGSGMANGDPINGDVRYVPSTWSIQNTAGSWLDNFSGAFSISQSGTYTLNVTFQKQVYNGGWKNTDIADSKSVTFTVGGASVNGSNNAVRINPQTGDTTPILPFVIILVVAAAAIIAVLVYRRKRK